MAAGIKSIRQKLYFSSMVLAISLVVMGGLLTFHLELIYGYKVSDWHSPYSKNHKNDTKTYKKDLKKDGSSKSKHLSFVTEKPPQVVNQAVVHRFILSLPSTVSFQRLTSLFFRGPPASRL